MGRKDDQKPSIISLAPCLPDPRIWDEGDYHSQRVAQQNVSWRVIWQFLAEDTQVGIGFIVGF